MPEETGRTRVLARWESRGGKDYAELIVSDNGFGWKSKDGMGWFGNESLEGALRIMLDRTAAGANYFCEQKSAMRTTYAAPEVIEAGGVM